jgi:dihydroflavonol-4-reductase
MILDFLNGRTPAFLNSMVNMIDVRDIAAGHIAASERGAVGERYILGNRNLWIAQLLDMLKELTQLTMPSFRVPASLAYLIGMASEAWADAVSGRPPRAPLTGVKLARFPVAFDSTKAVSELGLPQSPIRNALRDQILWMKSNGLLTRALSLEGA